MPAMPLTLAEAIRTGRLPEFIAQREAAELPAADRAAFDRALRRAVKPGGGDDRTFRSRDAGGSTGKRTRRGKAASSPR